MALSRRNLTLAFTLAAGIGIGAAGNHYLRGTTAQTPDEPPATSHTTPPAKDGTQITAKIIAVSADSLRVRAHLWPGQYAEFSISRKHSQLTLPDGTSVTQPETGQDIVLQDTTADRFGGTAKLSKEKVAGPVRARVTRIIDGDTFEAAAEIWDGVFVITNVRMGGIDTPEKKGRADCPSEAALAEKATASTTALIDGRDVLLHNIEFEKYGGRVLADVRLSDGTDAAQDLVKKGLARPYGGGTKSSWCK